MRLINPTDAQLDAAFAEKVAGWKRSTDTLTWWNGLGSWEEDGPQFTRSMDAVLPWLEKGSFHVSRNYFMAGGGHENLWCVHFLWWDESENKSKEGKSDDKFLPRACVIALLRAHGVEVEFT